MRCSALLLRNLSGLIAIFGVGFMLQGCASKPVVVNKEFDFAPLALTVVQPAKNITVSLADISAPVALDSDAMLYRLHYDNPQLLRPYAQHRWSMSPSRLLTQRLKARIAAAGFNVVSAGDGVASAIVLKMDLDEFSQNFTSLAQSSGQIHSRVSAIRGRTLIAQRSFRQQAAASTADAEGGAKALQDASDALSAELLQWLQSLTLPAGPTAEAPVTGMQASPAPLMTPIKPTPPGG